MTNETLELPFHLATLRFTARRLVQMTNIDPIKLNTNHRTIRPPSDIDFPLGKLEMPTLSGTRSMRQD